MKFEVKWDERGFKRVVEKAANDGVERLARKNQKVLDDVWRVTKGEPVESVLSKLRPALRRAGWTLSEQELRRYAEAISGGRRIVLGSQKLHL